MSTLYEITGDYLRLLEMLEEDENIDPQAFADTLAGIEGESEKYAAEVGRMQKRMETLANNEKRLKQHLFDSMKATGKLKFKTDLFSFGIQKNGGLQPMEIFPDVAIPDEYCRKEPDNNKIREALKNGAELPFAVLYERGDHLVIR